MKRTQSGFAHLALILLLLVVVVVAFAGYNVVKNNQSTNVDEGTNATGTASTIKVINNKADLNSAVQTLDAQSVDNDLNPDELNSDIENLL